MMKKKIPGLGVLALFLASLASPLSASVMSDNTYRLGSTKEGACVSQVPIVVTEKWSFTAGHCLAENWRRIDPSYDAQNEKGKVSTFHLRAYQYTKPGEMDFAVLDNPTGTQGVKIGDSKHLKTGQHIQIYSPKLGLTKGMITSVPLERLNPHVFINIGACGESGSGVYNDKDELIGIFTNKTYGDQDNEVWGAFIPIHIIMKVSAEQRLC